MIHAATIIFTIFLKFALPVSIIFFPFIGGWANFVLDTVDGDILIPLGLEDSVYQPMDKIADWVTYLGMVLAAWKFKWGIRKWVYWLFVLRSVGQTVFLITGLEQIFFFFPNFLEPFFLAYATIFFFKNSVETRTYKFYRKHKWTIWIFVVLYKMQDEYITHIANVERTEFLKNFFGGLI